MSRDYKCAATEQLDTVSNGIVLQCARVELLPIGEASNHLLTLHLSLRLFKTVKDISHIPCTFHAALMPCRAAKGSDFLSYLIYTVWPYLIHTCHAVPLLRSCRATTMAF
jgi:hypothetical protein